jgi:hypothetical protein
MGNSIIKINIMDLPEEILIEILLRLKIKKDIYNFLLTCKKFNNLKIKTINNKSIKQILFLNFIHQYSFRLNCQTPYLFSNKHKNYGLMAVGRFNNKKFIDVNKRDLLCMGNI